MKPKHSAALIVLAAFALLSSCYFTGCAFSDSPTGKRVAAFGKVAEQVALAAAEKYAQNQLQLWIEEATK